MFTVSNGLNYAKFLFLFYIHKNEEFSNKNNFYNIYANDGGIMFVCSRAILISPLCEQISIKKITVTDLNRNIETD